MGDKVQESIIVYIESERSPANQVGVKGQYPSLGRKFLVVKVSLSTDVLSDEYCANLLHLSPAYFNDLLKYEIGKEFKEYIQFKRFLFPDSIFIKDFCR